MKITKLSLAAIAAMTLTTGAMADIDMKIGGQTVLYYQTADAGANDMFSESGSSANAGIQLNANADLGNGFGLGLQGTALSTFGLEGNLVDGVRQSGLGNNGDTANAGDYFGVTKAYLTKKIANTTLKMGRQELPKSLSPLAFSEGWNVFKNTFDAIVAINSDIPDTTLVGAYVSRANEHGNLSDFNTVTGTATENGGQNNGTYMLTAANKSIENTPVTVSYYKLPSSDLSALWADAKVNGLGAVKVALQGGSIMNAAKGANDSKAIGAKVSGAVNGIDLSLAYSEVSEKGVPIVNLGTAGFDADGAFSTGAFKTPLYTQMVGNQKHIATANNTFVLGAAMPVANGKISAKYDITSDDTKNSDYNELDLIYKFKALGTNVLAAYVMQTADDKIFNGDDKNNIIRVWSRYNF